MLFKWLRSHPTGYSRVGRSGCKRKATLINSMPLRHTGKFIGFNPAKGVYLSLSVVFYKVRISRLYKVTTHCQL